MVAPERPDSGPPKPRELVAPDSSNDGSDSWETGFTCAEGQDPFICHPTLSRVKQPLSPEM